jgi:hypothetical protein
MFQRQTSPDAVLTSTFAVFLFAAASLGAAQTPGDFRLVWKENILTIRGRNVPGEELEILYIEAYCREGSTDRDWAETTIGHKTELVRSAEDGRSLELKCSLRDGVTLTHSIRAVDDGVDFRMQAHNPTQDVSRAVWGQPCIRIGKFTGAGPAEPRAAQPSYIRKCFLFLDGQLTRLPTTPWATTARYTPGQVWAMACIDRNDVNPRPLSELIPSNSLIGCFSADETAILATAWEPCQELFQGVRTCIHSDFRIGGLKPGETKDIHGKIYLVKNDADELLKRYRRDFPQR